MTRKHALIAGVHGVAGRGLVRLLGADSAWKVTGLSRRQMSLGDNVDCISADLQDKASVASAIGDLTDVSHIFYAAFNDHGDYAEQVGPNTSMMINLIEQVEASSNRFERIVIVQGAKFYGAHLGAFRSPAKESDPRHMPPNFYYNQEDYLRGRQSDAPWTWSAVRPGSIYGPSLGSSMNMLMVVAVYAAISRHVGVPLCFPGSPRGYRALRDITDSDLLARAMLWAGTEKKCAGEAFNVTNGQPIRWENVWALFAKILDIEVGPLRQLDLTKWMSDKAPLWDEIVRKHQLVPNVYSSIVSWPFGDAQFRYEHDILLDTTKLREFGFNEFVNNEKMFETLFTSLRRDRLVP